MYVHDYCEIAEPLFWDLGDTDDTIRQIKRHNTEWDAVCGSE